MVIEGTMVAGDGSGLHSQLIGDKEKMPDNKRGGDAH
jgi:hypothetical protein